MVEKDIKNEFSTNEILCGFPYKSLLVLFTPHIQFDPIFNKIRILKSP